MNYLLYLVIFLIGFLLGILFVRWLSILPEIVDIKKLEEEANKSGEKPNVNN